MFSIFEPSVFCLSSHILCVWRHDIKCEETTLPQWRSISTMQWPVSTVGEDGPPWSHCVFNGGELLTQPLFCGHVGCFSLLLWWQHIYVLRALFCSWSSLYKIPLMGPLSQKINTFSWPKNVFLNFYKFYQFVLPSAIKRIHITEVCSTGHYFSPVGHHAPC